MSVLESLVNEVSGISQREREELFDELQLIARELGIEAKTADLEQVRTLVSLYTQRVVAKSADH